jgi:hypothetical protein
VVRVETQGWRELGVVVSCGRCVRKGRRTELDVGGEPPDNSHGSTAERTRPESEARRIAWLSPRTTTPPAKRNASATARQIE